MDADVSLCRSLLAALEQWLEGLRGNTEADAETETKRMLRVLVEDFAAMLEGNHDIHWPRSIAALLSRKVSAATGHGALLHTAIAAGTVAGAEAEKVALLLEMDSLQAQIAAL